MHPRRRRRLVPLRRRPSPQERLPTLTNSPPARAPAGLFDRIATLPITSGPDLDMFELSRRVGHSTYRLTADTYSHLCETDDPAVDEKLDAAFHAASPVAPVIAMHRA